MPPQSSSKKTAAKTKPVNPRNRKPKEKKSTAADAKADIAEAEDRITEAYLYKEHPGQAIKERSVWVTEVKDIKGERMDEYELEKEYLLIGDNMTEYAWVPSSKFFAPQKVFEYQARSHEIQVENSVREAPLPYNDFIEREDRVIPLRNINPKGIIRCFSQTVDGKTEQYFLVLDHQDRKIVMKRDVVKKEFPKVYNKWLCAFYGFEIL